MAAMPAKPAAARMTAPMNPRESRFLPTMPIAQALF
jgi:hypothetical protein